MSPAPSAIRRCCAYLRAQATVRDNGGTVTLLAEGMGVFLATRATYEAALGRSEGVAATHSAEDSENALSAFSGGILDEAQGRAVSAGEFRAAIGGEG
jgi:hypothetical protein